MSLRASILTLLLVLALIGAAAKPEDDLQSEVIPAPPADGILDKLRALPNQSVVAIFAAVIGLLMLCGVEKLLKICLIIVTGVIGGIVGMSKIDAAWSLQEDIATKHVAGLEVGLIVAYISYVGYDGLLAAFGGLLGLTVAWKSIDVLDHIGFNALDPESQTSHMMPLLYYSAWALAAMRYFDKSAHLRVLGVVCSIIGGALVSSAVSWGITHIGLHFFHDQLAAHGWMPVSAPWVDFLYMLISWRGKDVGILAGWQPANKALHGMVADRVFGQLLWVVVSYIGIKVHLEKHSWNALEGKYDSTKTVLAQQLLSSQ